MEWYYVGLSVFILSVMLVAILSVRKQVDFASKLKAGDAITYNGRKGTVTSTSGHEATILLKVPKMSLSE